MANVYDQFNSLTPAEQEYIKSHPLHVLIIEEAKSSAFSETQRRFGINGPMTNLTHSDIVFGPPYCLVSWAS